MKRPNLFLLLLCLSLLPGANLAAHAQSPLTAANLAGKSDAQLALMRNAYYARHGYLFSGSSPRTAAIKHYFEGQSWYDPDSDDSPTVLARMTPTERHDIDLIVRTEHQRAGLTPLKAAPVTTAQPQRDNSLTRLRQQLALQKAQNAALQRQIDLQRQLNAERSQPPPATVPPAASVSAADSPAGDPAPMAAASPLSPSAVTPPSNTPPALPEGKQVFTLADGNRVVGTVEKFDGSDYSVRTSHGVEHVSAARVQTREPLDAFTEHSTSGDNAAGPNDDGGHDYSRPVGSPNDPTLSTGWTGGHGDRTVHVHDYYRTTKSGKTIHVHGYYRSSGGHGHR